MQQYAQLSRRLAGRWFRGSVTFPSAFHRFQSSKAFSSTAARSAVTAFTEEQEALREMTRKFANETIAPLTAQMDVEGRMDPSVVESLFQQGFMGVEIEEKFGGAGGSFTDACLVVEEIARVDPAVAVMVDIHNTLINRCLSFYGSEAQREKYLPKVATEIVGSFCLSESGSGSDAFALKCRAEKVDGGWKLNGAKQWISNSKEAGVFLVFATVDPEKRHKGITCFIVDAGAPGLEIGGKYDKLGIRASSTCEVILSDCFVPDENVLGKVGEGYKVAIESLNEGRIGIAAQMVGLAKGAWEHAVRYAHERVQFGQPISEFQAVRFQFAEMRAEIEAAQVLVYNAAALKESGRPFTMEAAIAKLQAGRVAERVASQAVEMLGGYGFVKEYPVEKFFRDSKIGSIYEGTTAMQLETISKLIQKDFR
uniref:Short/branched chain specific acyl-CoA dehydrogenase, mitochondrial n=1 Tax=Chromera velia CCMP2878 TaxID=1169474 RepID=A0A0G4H630_9ALVE|eukprot:Cvel_24840.t1-p1 / transcript=Cvel_24840.t1 / gene=Cvel_24840 / organism=Chromera_velia_CCMP2878 / gene_product=Probable short/branched chain specific acyl-CoA, putative / transcript_product=Probable short/branched chain specific acyl-CoA, putative / location=Cvel_scaffold2740:12919-17855(+) / protein_length=423 / sequence_SO=supercontig / SO=protein_coding / is_pseudo=false